MIHTLITFVASLLGWSGLLWFGIKPDFLKFSTPLLLLLHLLPPLALALTVWWRQQREKNRAAEEAREREEAERKEKAAARAAALVQHEQEIAWRRQGCDCRAVAVAGLLQHEAGPTPEWENVRWHTIDTDDDALQQRPQDPLTALLPHLQHALSALYEQSPAAAHFPIYLAPPSCVPGEQLILQVRQIAQATAQALELTAPTPSVRYLPSADNTAQRLIGLFEQQPELAGAVVLGFDSPLAQQAPEDPDEEPPAQFSAAQHQHGAAGQAVVALLLTHPKLDTILAELEQHELAPNNDPLLPHWERAQLEQLEYRQLATIALEQRDTLATLPALARIHRGVSQQFADDGPKPLALTKQLRQLLQNALVNAGSLELDFHQPDPDHATTEPATTEAPPPSCAWLVHNAGGFIGSGGRISAISAALHSFDIDLNPIDEATNTVVRFGDVGAARPLLMTALAAIHAAQTQSAALCAEFTGASEVSVYLAQPLTT